MTNSMVAGGEGKDCWKGANHHSNSLSSECVSDYCRSASRPWPPSPKKQNGFKSFSCGHGRRIGVESQSGGATLEGGDAPLALLFFVALLPLVNEVFATGAHEIHHACEFVRRDSVGAGLVHPAAQAKIKCTECGVAARQAHRGHF
jgi:hypothetical protein